MTINWDKLKMNVEKNVNKNVLNFKRRKHKEFRE